MAVADMGILGARTGSIDTDNEASGSASKKAKHNTRSSLSKTTDFEDLWPLRHGNDEQSFPLYDPA
jgi:hypothetical protein